jgi:hypothetical protein
VDEPDVLAVPELPEAPLLLPAVPDEPGEETAPDGLCTVVVLVGVCTVVVVTGPDAPAAAAPPCAGSVVVVMVVVLCAKAVVAAPISDRKIAIGNLFMFTPSFRTLEIAGLQETVGSKF